MRSTLVNLANEMLLKHFDAKIVRRPSPDELNVPGADTRVVFFHPPKCGGTSIRRVFAQMFAAGNERRIFELDPVASRRAAEQIGCSMEEMRESILSYAVQMPSLRYIGGHFPYSNRAVDNCSGDWQLMTVLREPIRRTLSLYYFNRARNEQRDHFGIETELSEWLETDEALSAGTIYLRMFLGDVARAKTVALPGVGADTVSQAVSSAIENLKRFTIVGLLEDLETYREAVRRHYSLELSIPHKNKNPRDNYPTFDEQPDDIRQKLQKVCEADLEIYSSFAGRET